MNLTSREGKFMPTNPHAPQCPWYDFTQTVGAPNIKWCEETLCAWISEPANTWSNLLYMILAVFVCKQFSKSKHMLVSYLGPSMFFMGAMSFVYHMSNNYFTQLLDFVGMYALLMWVFILNLMRLKVNMKKSGYWTLYTIFVLFLTALVHVLYLENIKFQFIVVVIGLAIGISEFFVYKSKKEQGVSYANFIKALVIIIIAETFSLLDVNRVMCTPDNHIIQGHAIWHVIGAIGIYYLCMFYSQPNMNLKEHA